MLAQSIVFLAIAATSQAGASPVFWRVEGYKSAVDSPFDLASGDYYLEDFEDRQANTPGLVIASLGKDGGARILGPANGAESVDDGGSSLLADKAVVYWDPDPFPNNNEAESLLKIDFDPDVLGGLPTDFAMVITKENISPEFFSFSVQGNGIGGGWSTTTDGLIGAHLDEGISFVLLSMRATSINRPVFQIDHIQYGAITPEPASAALLATGAVGLLVVGRRRRSS